MISLTATYSDSLEELILSGDPPIDGIEIGPWYSVRDIDRIQQKFSEWPFQFHAGSVITRWQVWPGARWKLSRYLDVAHGEWISVHLELMPWYVYLMSAHVGLHLDPPPVDKAVDNFMASFERFSRSVDLPILLENLPSLPLEKYNYAADPGLIAQIVDHTGTEMVLDIAHARIAACYQNTEVKSYLSDLPLDHVKQIHVSGVGIKDGMLYDGHKTLGKEDYELLAWILDRAEPGVVTLEYFRGKQALQDQLLRLRAMVGE